MNVADAWIITGGTKTGVMELVGEAANEHMLRNGLAEQNIVILGIVPWHMIANKKILVNKKTLVSTGVRMTSFLINILFEYVLKMQNISQPRDCRFYLLLLVLSDDFLFFNYLC